MSKTLLIVESPAKSKTLGMFMNREINTRGIPKPFSYQFGDTGGLLERPKNKYNDYDSLTAFRPDFQQKLIKFKEEFSMDDKIPATEYLKKM